MKKYYIIAGFLILFTTSAFAQKTTAIDLHKLVKDKGVNVYNRELSLVNEDGHQGIRLSKDEGEGIAWIKGIEFSNGILEFEVRGEDVKQHSFVGLAFHGVDNATFDAIYFRPFHFKSQDEVAKSRQVQYVSLPGFPWRTLRENSPGKYEHVVDPAPDPNGWFKVRIVVQETTISTYVNGSNEPCLVVEKVTKVSTGSIGFYVADTSGGDFANLTITKTN
jgi:hypothetical protein